MRAAKLLVVSSTACLGKLSLRARDGGDLRDAVKNGGLNAGDHVVLVLQQDLDRLERRLDRYSNAVASLPICEEDFLGPDDEDEEDEP